MTDAQPSKKDEKIVKGLHLTRRAIELIELARDSERAEGRSASQSSVVEAAIRKTYGKLDKRGAGTS
ncbi:MAG: hypothetical protein LBE25_09310 [Arthrobacter sp.]|jgi:hypothetical protein|nr:hypothetical protein [Arthrobacter sp.]